jgi:hypothetical protein
MSSAGTVSRTAVPVSSARAEASRRNGSRSRGPKTPEGKARSSQNALKHGLRAEKHVVLPDEDGAEFAAFKSALIGELAPQGALQSILVERIAVATWRLARADQIEAELLSYRRRDGCNLAIALIRDGNGTRSLETVLRYRGAAQADFMRSLRMLKALQAEQSATPARAVRAAPAPVLRFEPKGRRSGAAAARGADQGGGEAKPRENPIKPDRAEPRESGLVSLATEPRAQQRRPAPEPTKPGRSLADAPVRPQRSAQPNEPERTLAAGLRAAFAGDRRAPRR